MNQGCSVCPRLSGARSSNVLGLLVRRLCTADYAALRSSLVRPPASRTSDLCASAGCKLSVSVVTSDFSVKCRL
uniref:SFRICE_023876 n=1 Tax=Spodoptera frugiperda TaxID=7108 RepID=A0A2H1WCZ6_SPOFR